MLLSLPKEMLREIVASLDNPEFRTVFTLCRTIRDGFKTERDERFIRALHAQIHSRIFRDSVWLERVWIAGELEHGVLLKLTTPFVCDCTSPRDFKESHMCGRFVNSPYCQFPLMFAKGSRVIVLPVCTTGPLWKNGGAHYRSIKLYCLANVDSDEERSVFDSP